MPLSRSSFSVGTSANETSILGSFTLASTTMKFDITEGTYVNKKDKEFVEYLVKCGRWDNFTEAYGITDTQGGV